MIDAMKRGLKAPTGQMRVMIVTDGTLISADSCQRTIAGFTGKHLAKEGLVMTTKVGSSLKKHESSRRGVKPTSEADTPGTQ